MGTALHQSSNQLTKVVNKSMKTLKLPEIEYYSSTYGVRSEGKTGGHRKCPLLSHSCIVLRRRVFEEESEGESPVTGLYYCIPKELNSLCLFIRSRRFSLTSI